MKMITRYGLLLMVLGLTHCSPDRKSDNTTGDYEETYRPKFHFSPKTGWMNDPNGMVYFDGVYHLFYQYYPDSNIAGPRSWGHATSKDMVQWMHQPVALSPDTLGEIYSGSAVMDSQNSSGFGTRENPAMIAIFTYHFANADNVNSQEFEYQGIASSLDEGKTWTKYSGNPVLRKSGEHDFRDPKVFWHESSKQWKMILSQHDHVELYGSNDLKSWEYLSSFGKEVGEHGGVWECPDLFEMNVEGISGNQWVMLVNIGSGGYNGGSATQYFTGQFDGKTFTTDQTETLWVDYGKDNYAGVTWSNIPASDGRRLFIGWMSNWQYGTVVPTHPWRSAMTVPRTLSLVRTNKGFRLASRPVRELESIREGPPAEFVNSINFGDTVGQVIPLPGDALEIQMEIEQENADRNFAIELSNDLGERVVVGFQAGANQLYIDRSHSGLADFSSDFAGMHIGKRITSQPFTSFTFYLDASSLEVFADDGTLCMTELLFPTAPYNAMKVHAPQGGIVSRTTKVFSLKSIWKNGTEAR